jgi:hypothetical protein
MLSGHQDPGSAEADNNGRRNETVDDTRDAGDSFGGNNDDDDDYDGAVDDPTVLACTELAKVARKYSVICPFSLYPTDLYW